MDREAATVVMMGISDRFKEKVLPNYCDENWAESTLFDTVETILYDGVTNNVVWDTVGVLYPDWRYVNFLDYFGWHMDDPEEDMPGWVGANELAYRYLTIKVIQQSLTLVEFMAQYWPHGLKEHKGSWEDLDKERK
jgi:hypothetical protein